VSASRRIGATLGAAAAIACLAYPAAAGAHLRSGTVAVDYRAAAVGGLHYLDTSERPSDAASWSAAAWVQSKPRDRIR
jgi:hypothetical protein